MANFEPWYTPPDFSDPSAGSAPAAPVSTPSRHTPLRSDGGPMRKAGPTILGGIDITALSGDQRNAFIAIEKIFESFGLATLAPQILKMVQQGYDQTTIGFLLQETPEYKARFAGNDLRVKNGFAALDPASYLQVEAGYRDAARAYGLPTGFYDDPADFANLIGANVSASEFADRAGHAFKYVQTSNQGARDALRSYYGVDDSHLVAYFLDPSKGQAILDRQAAAVNIGAAASNQGVKGVDRTLAEKYADLGVSEDQALRGFGDTAQSIAEGQLNIAQRFRSDLSAQDIADEFVAGLASARRKRRVLNESERALFSGDSGTSSGSFSSGAAGTY